MPCRTNFYWRVNLPPPCIEQLRTDLMLNLYCYRRVYRTLRSGAVYISCIS